MAGIKLNRFLLDKNYYFQERNYLWTVSSCLKGLLYNPMLKRSVMG